MSVWKNVSYRDSAFQWFTRNLPPAAFSSSFVLDLLDFDVEDPKDFPLPAGIKQGNLKEQMQADINAIALLSTQPAAKPSEALHQTIKNLPKPLFGLHAAYHFIGKIWEPLWDTYEGRKFELAMNILAFGVTGAGHSFGDLKHRKDDIINAQEKWNTPARAFMREFLKARSSYRKMSVSSDIRNSEALGKALPFTKNHGITILPNWDVLAYRGMLLLVDPLRQNTFVILQDEFERIEKFVIGASQVRIYAEMYGMLEKDSRRKFVRAVIRWQNYAVDQFRNIQKGWENFICRSFDVAYNIFLARHAQDVSDRALVDQNAKWKKEELGNYIKREIVFNIVKPLSFKEAIEVLQQYKLFPAPDFDYFGMLGRQRAMYIERRQTANNFWDKPEFDEVLLYYKWMMVKGFHSRHGYCPGFVKEEAEEKNWHNNYPSVAPKQIHYTEVGDIDLGGSFIYRERRKDCLDLVKDKAICPKKINSIESSSQLAKLPPKEKSQLVDVLSRSEVPDTRDLWENFDNLDFDVKADDKPEAKKPNGRMFFELGTDARLAISEYEDSVASYAKFVPGVVAGVDASKMTQMMNMCTSSFPVEFHDTQLFISFDLEKWSPTFQAEAHVKIDKLWAEAFGKPELVKASNIFSKGKIHYVKGRVHHSFDKIGNEYEGHFARKGTIFHAAVMGLTVNKLRKEGILKRGANFAALLDDGLLRVVLDKKNVKRDAQLIMDKIEESYNKAGYFISWDKTFFSSKFAIFLNEIRVMGRSVTPGVKSILKISNRADVICPNLAADIEFCNQTARGAISTGATPFGAYAVFSCAVADAVYRWCKVEDTKSVTFALRSFLPIKNCGLGVAPLNALVGSITYDSLIEALGVLRAIGFRYPDLKKPINEMLNQGVESIADKEQFSNPIGIRSTGKRIRSDRASVLVERHLSTTYKAPALGKVYDLIRSMDVGRVDTTFQVCPSFPVECRTRIWESSLTFVLKQVVDKFQKSRSALVFVPFRSLYRATLANKTEAVAYAKVYLQ